MKLNFSPTPARGFTLLELTFAVGIAVVVTGSFVLLLVQAAREQLKGYAAATVEEKAYVLQTQISSCLRGMSENQGASMDYGTTVTDTNGNLLGYSAIFVFTPTNGAYVCGRMQFDSASGAVRFIPNVSNPSAQTLWATNSATARVTQCYFALSDNQDGTQDSSLVRVTFAMDDNGCSLQSATNNPASVLRSFAVQMRND